MVVMINGSFGVGKSTVAGLLQTQLPKSRIYDPEIVGSILMRLPTWIHLHGRGTDDFQDIDLWRKSVSAGIRFTRWRNSGNISGSISGAIIVPMTFDRHDYLNEITTAIRHFDPNLHIFCLRANLGIIRQRLHKRGDLEGPGSAWITRRIVDCAKAHEDPAFGAPIETGNSTPQEVVEKILSQL